jgi:hypothetical protein
MFAGARLGAGPHSPLCNAINITPPVVVWRAIHAVASYSILHILGIRAADSACDSIQEMVLHAAQAAVGIDLDQGGHHEEGLHRRPVRIKAFVGASEHR